MSNKDTKIEKIEEVLKLTTDEKVQFIAKASDQIMSAPYQNLPKVQNLLHLLDVNDIFIAKVVSLSLTQVFKDIAPLYKIQKEEIEQKLKQVIRKDERKILNFEYMLLTYYEKFLNQNQKKNQDSLRLLCQQLLLNYIKVCFILILTLISQIPYQNIYLLKILKCKILLQILQNIYSKKKTLIYVNQQDKSKLTLVEKFGSFLKNRKLEKLISLRLWETLIKLKFDYQEEIKDKTEKVDKQKQYVEKLQNLKDKGKLSKRRERELKEKSTILEKMNYKLQKEKEKKALLRQVHQDLKKAETNTDTKKHQKIAKQILLKVLFIIFKVLQVYPDSKGLTSVLKCLNKNFLRMDRKFQSDILEKLKDTFDHYNNKKDQNNLGIFNKKLFLLDCIIKISKEKNSDVQIEQFYSLKCFYSILCHLLQNSTILIDNKENSQITLLYLFENLLLNQQIFSKEVKENFLIAIMTLAYQIKQCKNLKITLTFFIYQFLTKYTKLYLSFLDQDQSTIPQDQLKKDKLLDYLTNKKLFNTDPFIESPSDFPYIQILNSIQWQLSKIKDVKIFTNSILEKKSIQSKFIGKRISTYYKDLCKPNQNQILYIYQ